MNGMVENTPAAGADATGDTSAQPAANRTFVGWWVDPGSPFAGPVTVPYRGASLVLLGPNGYGKTRLLQAIIDRRSPRLYSRLPPRLAPYLAIARKQALFGGTERAEPTDEDLYAECEGTQAVEDDEDWWWRRLQADRLRWLLRFKGPGAVGRICGVDAANPAESLVSIPAASRHLDAVIERWTVPDLESLEVLASQTMGTFRTWIRNVSSACREGIAVQRNPLVARLLDGRSASLLPVASRFADFLAERSSKRLRQMAGFDIELRCTPEDDFTWEFTSGGAWIALDHASRAISRWAALAVNETLQELLRAAEDAAELEIDLAPHVIDGELPAACLPPGPPRAFSTRSAWIALDEPEVHLFPCESRSLGSTLSDYSREGRLLIATHSLDLAGRLVGHCQFVTFERPGHLQIGRPTAELRSILTMLAAHGPAVLADTRVLYVEGTWDVEILRRLHGVELDGRNVLLSSMNGVLGANLAASSVWHQLVPTPLGMMFDALNAADVGHRWQRLLNLLERDGRQAVLRDIRHQIRNAQRGPFEVRSLLRLFETAIESKLEDRLQFVMHGLSDIFQILHPCLFGLTGETWASVGYDGRDSFKSFIRRMTDIDLSRGDHCRVLVEKFDLAGRPTETVAAQALRTAIKDFVSCSPRTSDHEDPTTDVPERR